ncbi:CU044_5270 family protein [Streptomyces sp. MBT49]|uniref:CU044_5270 family protein n=1 Tax=Streptomyces sp. MBT49 TaxID=1488380 RepID=UPI00190BECFE|nr:CU044_5270 family protein [Streptomyces sp. MBT49]MBK3627042.1 CU044_5270 family protein [Streptomyces sp. MBT49]
MNSTPVGPERERLEELRELEGLLPTAPAEQVLPPGRRSHHKDVLMQLIDSDSASADGTADDATATAAGRGAAGGGGGPAPLRGRRFSRPALVAGAVAAALAAGLTVGLGPHQDGGGTAAPGASGTAGGAHGSRGAVATLGRIAAVAMRTDVTPVGDGQFVYVRSTGAENDGVFDGRVKLGKMHERQVWFSQRQGPVTDVGLIREFGQDWPIEVGVPDGTDPADSAVPAGVDRPTYAWLASLPTDPDALLELIYADTPAEKGEDRDQAVFDRIGDLVGEQIMPSATAAAFYRATARIPGVTEVADAVDAAGRHGIAIAREDTRHGTRTEWIFDPGTLGYLGVRTVFSRDTERARAGTVYDTSAVLERAVVDRRGQEPGERRRAERG